MNLQITGRYILLETVEGKECGKILEIFKANSGQSTQFAKVVFRTKHDDDVFSFNTSFIPLNLFPDIIDDIKIKKHPMIY